MGQIIDIGTRIELVSMDAHFNDISIALYEQHADDGPRFLVHTYSQKVGATGRVDFITAAMVALGGMEPVAASAQGRMVRFPCGARHFAAVKRLFLESCKIASGPLPEPRPLAVFDKKADAEITAVGEGGGQYRITAQESTARTEGRIRAIAGGLIKLAELEAADDSAVRFSCGHDLDLLVGLLLPRAINVRAAMREQEQSASRGVLAAPSQQE